MNDCCGDPANLSDPEPLGEDLSVRRCQVCGASHYELELDPANLVTEVEAL